MKIEDRTRKEKPDSPVRNFMPGIILLAFLLFCIVFSAGCVSEPVQSSPSNTYINKYIDLHLHLDGEITPDIARKLAAVQNISIPLNESELNRLLQAPRDCNNLNDFLSCFEFPGSLLQTREGIRLAVYLLEEKMKQDGVVYAEIRFAPQKQTENGLSQEEAVLAALEGMNMSDLKTNLILCLMRGGNKSQNFETIEVAKKYLVEDGGVVAIDLAGAESLYPTADYKIFFDKAKEYGIPYTIHAGEADGASSVWSAVEFGAKRIGHGVRSYEDPALLQTIRDNGIVLEMCPTSNRMTNAVENMADYPFMDYLNSGIRVTLNTDNPGIENTTIAQEYRYMEKMFGLTPEQEKIILSNSVDAAFTSNAVKEELRRELGL